MNITDDLIEDAKAVEVIAWEWYDEAGNVQLTHEEPPEIGATRITPLTAIQRQRERQAAPSGFDLGKALEIYDKQYSGDPLQNAIEVIKHLYDHFRESSAAPSPELISPQPVGEELTKE